MGTRTTLRKACRHEAEQLTALCMRSKAHWGYDADFMNQCREALTVQSQWIDKGWVVVAELAGDIAGIAAIAPDGPAFEIMLFFVEPSQMGKGIGRALWDRLLSLAREKQVERLRILSDPNAVAFYSRMGARLIGTEPSDAIAGRSLPLLEIDVAV